MSNEPIKTAAEILYQYSNVKGGNKGHYEDETQIVWAMEQHASQQTAELQREVDVLRNVLTRFVNSTYTGCSKDELNTIRIEAEQALKDK